MAEEYEGAQIDLEQEHTSDQTEAEPKQGYSNEARNEPNESFQDRNFVPEREESSQEISTDEARPSTPPNLFCRICHEKDLPTERNISPCRCKGTLSLVHRSCLREWLVASDSTHCELCGYQFTVQRIPKYSVLSSLWHWVKRENSPVEQRYIVNNLAGLVLDFPVILSSNYLWFAKADSLLRVMESIMESVLPFQDGQDLFNETLTVIGQMVNLLLVCPIGILTGSHLMIYMFRVFEQGRLWYVWHRRQTTLILDEPTDRPQ